jgi:hypothetical protein
MLEEIKRVNELSLFSFFLFLSFLSSLIFPTSGTAVLYFKGPDLAQLS